MPAFEGSPPLADDDERRRQAMRDQLSAGDAAASAPSPRSPASSYNPAPLNLTSGILKGARIKTAAEVMQPAPAFTPTPSPVDPARDPLRPTVFPTISGPTVPGAVASMGAPSVMGNPITIAPKVLAPAVGPTLVTPTAPAIQPTAARTPLPAPIVATPRPPTQPAAVPAPAAPSVDDPSLADAKNFLASAETTDDDGQEEARQQELRNQAATNRYMRAQGAKMAVSPTGQVQPATDQNGDVQYRPGTLSPFTRLEDGRAYRVSRDATGNQRYFDIEAQGQAGADYHVDPHSGDKYVLAPHPEGGSRREVIGHDPIVPALNDLRSLYGEHETKRQEVDQTISRAEAGAADALGLGRMSLPDLRKQHTAIVHALVPAQNTYNATRQFLKDGGTLNAQQLDAFRSASATLNQHAPAVQPLLDEISSREDAITAARQQRTSINADALETRKAQHWIRDKSGTSEIGDDLAAIAHGQPVSANRTDWYARAGLLAPNPQPDGSNRLAVTARGAAALDRETRARMAADPGSYNLTSDALPAPAAPQIALVPEDAPAQPAQAPEAAPASAGAETVAPPTDQPAKAYAVGRDGSVQFDPEQPTKGIARALQDGAIDHDTAIKALGIAKEADKQRDDLEKLAGGAPQLKALLAGVPAGLSFMGGGAAAAAAGNASGINPALSALTGPFAPATEAVLSGAEFLAGGALAARGAHKLQEKLGEYSTTIASLNAAGKLHPGYEMAGEIIPALPSAVSSVRNFGRMAEIAASDLGASATTAQKVVAGAKAVLPTVAKGAVSGALAEGALRPVVDAGINIGADALGVNHDDVQAPTIGSVAQMAALGALLAGHGGHEFHDYSPNRLGDLMSRGMAHMQTNTEMGLPIAPSAMMEKFGSNPRVDMQAAADWAKPLSASEQEMFYKAHSRLEELNANGEIDINKPFEGTGQQVLQKGKPKNITSVEFRQRKGVRNASEETPSTGPSLSLGEYTPDTPESSPTSSRSPSVPQSEASGSPIPFSPTTVLARTSAQPAPATPAGQVATAPAQPEREGQPADAPAATPHEAMAAHVNSGEPHPIDGSDASASFQVLSRLKARGVEITPELAQTVSGRVDNILADTASDPQAGLHALVREHTPAPSADTTPARSGAATAQPPASPADLQAENDTTRLENLTRARDNAQISLDRGTVRPEAVEYTRGMIAHLEAAIASLKPEAPARATAESMTGAKIDPTRTAFHPDSGTLGIPRDQMPQVASEHRGALANFLQARGVSWKNEEVLPDQLKPSQADFNEGKVRKAQSRAADPDQRRILVSSDNHIIDGHHQFLAALKDRPNDPMPIVRLNAPAKEILSQVHEFPSAGMQKAPDLADRIAVPRQPGDSDQRAAAREWIADERQAGRQPTAGDVTRKHRINFKAAGEMLAAQNRAEEAVGAPAVAGERVASGQTPTATTERLPVTPEGKQAKLTLARLAALRAKGVDLNGGHRTAQREAELTLARDLNDQVLTNPQRPVTAEDLQRRAAAK